MKQPTPPRENVAAADTTPEPAVFVCAADGTVLAAGAGSERLTGRPPEALSGAPISRVLLLVKPDRWPDILSGRAAGAAVVSGRQTHAHGDAKPLCVIGVPLILDGEPRVVVAAGLQCGAACIEDVLRASEAKYRALFEGSGDAVFLMSDRFVDCNQRAAEMLGCPREAVLGRPPADFSPERQPDGRLSTEAEAAHIAAALRGRAERFPWRHVRPDGSLVDVDVTLTSVEVGGQRLLQAMVRDVTAQRQAEAAMHASEERYRRLFNTSRDGIAIAALDGTFEDANAAFLDLLGYTLEELRRLPAAALTPPTWAELETSTIRPRLLEQGFVDDYEREFIRRDGQAVSVLVRSWLIRDDAGRPARVASVIRDLSALRRSEEEKRQLESQLVRAQRMEAVGQIAGGLAHDFNNVLTAILGNAELLRSQLDPRAAADASRLAQVEQIEQAAQRAALLTRQMLAFSRHQSAARQAVNVNHVVGELEPMLRRVITERIELELSLAPNLGIVQADPAQLEQVIMNLVVNARDAMPDGGRLVIETANVFLDAPAAASRSDARPGPHVLLVVRDTGCGMSAEVLDRIFEPFFTTKPVGQGTGLGLSTVFGIVRNLGGHIMVFSEVGRGSAFEVHLPAEPSSPAPPAPPPGDERSLTGSETILVCEDDETVRELTVRFLRSAGYTVLAAASADDALADYECSVRRISLLVTDVVMPGRSGPELVAELRARDPGLRTLYISGYAAADHGSREQPIRSEHLLEKPFSRRVLLERVRDVLSGPPQQ